MADELITHALNLILDDRRIGEWTMSEVEKRLGHSAPQDREFWQTYIAVTSELIEAARKLNDRALSR